jgi:hypothetical protein
MVYTVVQNHYNVAMKKKQPRPLRAIFVGFGNVARKTAAMLTVERKNFPGLKDLHRYLHSSAWSPGRSWWP